MQEFKIYLALILNEDCDQFDIVLDRLSHQSGLKPGARLATVVPMRTKTLYEVSLTVEEACALALSCPGEYKFYEEDKKRLFMVAYLSETEV